MDQKRETSDQKTETQNELSDHRQWGSGVRSWVGKWRPPVVNLSTAVCMSNKSHTCVIKCFRTSGSLSNSTLASNSNTGICFNFSKCILERERRAALTTWSDPDHTLLTVCSQLSSKQVRGMAFQKGGWQTGIWVQSAVQWLTNHWSYSWPHNNVEWIVYYNYYMQTQRNNLSEYKKELWSH